MGHHLHLPSCHGVWDRSLPYRFSSGKRKEKAIRTHSCIAEAPRAIASGREVAWDSGRKKLDQAMHPSVGSSVLARRPATRQNVPVSATYSPKSTATPDQERETVSKPPGKAIT